MGRFLPACFYTTWFRYTRYGPNNSLKKRETRVYHKARPKPAKITAVKQWNHDTWGLALAPLEEPGKGGNVAAAALELEAAAVESIALNSVGLVNSLTVRE